MKLAFALLAAAVLAPSVVLAGGILPVPEAGSTVSLLGLALTGLIFLRRRLH
jgi:protein with PEP-CTERM/exosortase system signal